MTSRIATFGDRVQLEIDSHFLHLPLGKRCLHGVGDGCPDVLVGYRRKNHLLEIKVKGGTLTPDQTMFHLAWKGSVSIVTTPEEALAAIGIRSDP